MRRTEIGIIMTVKERVIAVISNIDFEQTFITDEKRKLHLSYNGFFSRCLHIADFLKQRNERKIFVVIDNSVELCALYFAVIFAKKGIVVADPEKGNEELEELLADSQGAFPIVLKKGVEKNTDYYDMFYEAYEKECKAETVIAFQKYDFDYDYLTTFTSGTSGKTKGVVNSLNNLFSTSLSFIEKIPNYNEGCLLHLMPMTYMAGILNSIFMPFVMGYRIVIGERFSVKTAISFWKKVEKYNVSLLWLSPMMLTMIDKVDRGDYYEKYCRNNEICYLIGTAPLNEDVRRRFEERYGVKLRASYGLSETLFVSVETEKSISTKKRDNVGELLTGVDYKIMEDGELLINVPWMYKGYTNVNTQEYFDGKYYKSGDLAEIENGVLSIVGRKKDLIIRGGLNISPKMIEDIISQLDCFTEYCIFGKNNSIGEEEVCCAYVSKSEGLENDIESKVSDYVTGKLGKNYSINKFLKMDSLPRNINGKIDKNLLRGD